MNIVGLTIPAIRQKLAAKEISAVALARLYLERIKKTDPQIKAFITVTEEVAMEQANRIDKLVTEGKKLPRLAGVPFTSKDLFCTAGIKTTAASNILANYVPPFSATVVEKILKEGAVLLGKVNLDAFAHGSSTENSDFFPTRNPFDLERIPGGSSGGSAAAVAASLCVFSLGTETGGSIRLPAALCGITGFRPTYGRNSRYGVIAMASSLDAPGILANNVSDAALVAEIMAGFDERDASSSHLPVPTWSDDLDLDLRGLTVGVAEELFPAGLQESVDSKVREAIYVLERNGAKIKKISLPHAKYASPVYAVICPCEVSANLSRYDGIRYGYSIETDKTSQDPAQNLLEVYTKTRKHGFGNEAKRRILTGAFALSSGYYDQYYIKASKVRTLIREDWNKAFKEVDVVAGPTSPSLALRIGESKNDPLFAYLADELINPSSVAGLPGISVPCGMAKPDDGDKELPIGIQFVANQFNEQAILSTAYAFEQLTDFSPRQS